MGLITGGRVNFPKTSGTGLGLIPLKWSPALTIPVGIVCWMGRTRWSAYKSTGVAEVEAIIKDLDGNDPLLYAAKKAIGPRQLMEDEARVTARRAYAGNSSLSSADIGKAIGRARRTVDSYIADLRAVNQMGRDIKIFRMNRLCIPQDRIAERLGLARTPALPWAAGAGPLI